MWPAQPQAASISGFGFAFLIWAALPWEWIGKHYAFWHPYRDNRLQGVTKNSRTATPMVAEAHHRSPNKHFSSTHAIQ
jgi:hypothetical protein